MVQRFGNTCGCCHTVDVNQKSCECYHLGCTKPVVNNGINQLPTSTGAFTGFLVAINSIGKAPFRCFPITSICPAGGYRRRQNLHRWLATRTDGSNQINDPTKKVTPKTIGKRKTLIYRGEKYSSETHENSGNLQGGVNIFYSIYNLL